jgi:hypothetical protein
MTGVQRPEVKRILEAKQPKATKDYITRVLGLWCGNRSYYNKDGPKPLRLDHQQPSFHRLVAAVSTDLNPHTILFELERLNLVSIQEHRVTLSSQLYSTFGDELTTLDFGANDVNDLMHSIQENAERRVQTPNLHARTEFDNIPDEMIAQIREWLLEFGSAFHKKVHNYLSKRDKDMHPSLREKPGRNRVIFGSFSRIESIDNE